MGATGQVLHAFSTSPDGSNPLGGLATDASGALYGTTNGGGTGVSSFGNGLGTVFKLSRSGSSGPWIEQKLHDFPAFVGDGAGPIGELLADSAGTFYGAAYYGGAYGYGAIYQLKPPAPGTSVWTETVLHSFNDTDGANPLGGLIADATGALYGTATNGGPSRAGVVFKLSPQSGSNDWVEQTLYTFSAKPGPEGFYPNSHLVMDESGNLFGTTMGGGGTSGCCGIVFELSPPPVGMTAWTRTILFSFTGSGMGTQPQAGLAIDRNGALYGTTFDVASYGPSSCASFGCGTVFRLSPPAAPGTKWRYTLLHSFSFADGASPAAVLTFDTKGNLYGTTRFGGFATAEVSGGLGTVFKLSPPADGQSTWTETFVAAQTSLQGFDPSSAVLVGSGGAVYATASAGGPKGDVGSAFKIHIQ